MFCQKCSDPRWHVKHFPWNENNHQPLTGQSVSADRHRLRPTSCRSPERWEQVLSRPPAGGKTNVPTCERRYSAWSQLLSTIQSCASTHEPFTGKRRSPFSRWLAELWQRPQNGGEKHQRFRRIFQRHVALGETLPRSIVSRPVCIKGPSTVSVCLLVCPPACRPGEKLNQGSFGLYKLNVGE